MPFDMKKVGAGWKKTSKAGNLFISISIGEDLKKGDSLIAFPNKNKKQPKHPDFEFYLQDKSNYNPTPAPAAPVVEQDSPW